MYAPRPREGIVLAQPRGGRVMESGNFRRDSESPLSRDDGSVRVTEGGAQDQGYEYGSASGREYSNWGRPIRGYGYQQRPRYPTETRPSFLTSELVGTLPGIIALACTAAAMPNLGARLTWILIAAMVFTYSLSRGVAKAGTHSHSLDPRERLLGGGGDFTEQETESGGG